MDAPTTTGAFTTGLRERFYRLGQIFPGYDEVLTQALFALLTREHMLWYSKPGRAKSMVAKAIFELFTDAPTFSKQLTKDMMPEALFGNIIADELIKSGREIHNLDGGIITAVFAYLDEFFDASDYVLRALLNVLNEREFHSKDMGTVGARLHSVIATTNYLRQREATEAVLDRLLCKAIVPGITSIVDLMRAGQTYLGFPGKAMDDMPPLQYGDLASMSTLVELPEKDGGLHLSPGMRLLHDVLIQEFQRRRIQAATTKWAADNPNAADAPTEDDLGVPDISPRTVVKLHDFSRAAAALMNRTQVDIADHRALGYGLVVVGDDTGDLGLWHTTCDDLLTNWGAKARNSLEILGELADTIGQIKAEQPQVTQLQMTIGGQLVPATTLEIRRIVDTVTGSTNPVLSAARTSLRAEIRALDTCSPSHFNLVKGW